MEKPISKKNDAYKKLIYLTVIFVHTFIGTSATAQEWYQSKVIIVENTVDLGIDINDVNYELNKTEISDRAVVIKGYSENKSIIEDVLADMIYGYNFIYIPGDKRRNIEESWEITRIAELLPEDENLIRISQEIHQNRLSLVYRYNLSASQVRWLLDWEEKDNLSSGGTGVSFSTSNESIVEGYHNAIIDGIKISIRNRLQEEIVEKPLKIRGLVKLIEKPYFLRAGEYYTAKIKIRVRVEEIKEHQVF